MAPDRTDVGRGRQKQSGVHKKPGNRRSILVRAVAAGGAVACIGTAYDVGAPTADALSILLPGRTVNGEGTTTRINILEGNVFNPQLGILGGSVSDNTTIGNVVMGLGNDIINGLLSAEIWLPGATGAGNTTQINILSYNIFNPQISLRQNVSNNTTVNNVAMGNGNNSSTDVTTAGGVLPWFGGATGNGNTVQFSFFSGNIFNPQWSLLGGNISNNTAVTNVAIGNGNFSSTTVSLGGWFGGFLFGGGNGNTFQFGFFVSNIYNPQFTFGGGNISYNTATTNTASGNGNNSTTDVSGGGTGGTVGNGNTNQVATGSGNIYNDQWNIGPGSGSTVSSTDSDPVVQQLNNDAITVGSTSTDLNFSPAQQTRSRSADPDVDIDDTLDSNDTDGEQDALTSNGSDDPAALNTSPNELAGITRTGGNDDADIDSGDTTAPGTTGDGGEGGGDNDGGDSGD